MTSRKRQEHRIDDVHFASCQITCSCGEVVTIEPGDSSAENAEALSKAYSNHLRRVREALAAS